MTNDKTPPGRIVIVGGGTAGWMAANLIAKRWAGPGTEITLIESPDIGIIGVGEGSTPQLKFFFDELGVDERDWMAKCNATYKNGIRFENWASGDGAGYFHPFPSMIDGHTSPAFLFNSHFRRQGADLYAHPDRFFLSAYLAKHRLAPIAPRSFPFDMPYGYHFDANLVGAFLRDHAKTLGVKHEQARIVEITLAENGDIKSLLTDDEREIEADFFVDSTGFRSMLLQQKLGVPFKSYGENLFNDSAVVLPTPPDPDKTNSQTISTALNYGWAWDIPLRNRTGNGYVYSSNYCSPDEAEKEFRAHLGLLDSPVEARHLKMKVGRVERHWARNCLAVGLSQGFIEPLEATALHLVQATVENFMALYEEGGFTPAKQDEFNALVNARFEGVRDYIVCHYRVNGRNDTDYWRDNAENKAASDSLTGVLDCWFSGGDMKQEIARQNIAKYYSLNSWVCLLAGYDRYPKNTQSPPPELQRFDMTVIDDFMARCGMNFKDHKPLLAEQEREARE